MPSPYRVQAPIEGRWKRKVPVCIIDHGLRMHGHVGVHAVEQAQIVGMFGQAGKHLGSQSPLWPWRENLKGEAIRRRPFDLSSAGLPSSDCSSRLVIEGVDVRGRAGMYRKITRLARAGKWGGLGASGVAALGRAACAHILARAR